MFGRLVTRWVQGGFLAGLLLAVLTPVITRDWPPALAATWWMLPLYMLHQFEEHDADRFRLFVNALVGGGREVLTPMAVFVINVPGVWGVIGASLALAAYRSPGYGLIAVYLVLVNGAVHVAQALTLRRPNPGLVTASLLFLPLGAYALTRIPATEAEHALGLAVAALIHGAIIAHVRRRRQGG